jgi:uncharacterized membrane protein YtjA (UPF0391 family)
MYDQSSILIVFIVLVAMIAALEIGFVGARRKNKLRDDAHKSQLSAVQGSLLGLLALLLGFTFSLSLQRYDDRSKAVIDEANAIGTTWLRAQMLTPEVRDDAMRNLREYVDLRVRAAKVTLDHDDERQSLIAEAGRMHTTLWNLARKAVTIDDRPVTSGLFVQALNELIDAYGRRDAALNRHVPEPVLYLLFLTFVLVSGIVGYTSGASGSRPPAPALIMVVLIVLLVFLIIDLDRPRRGLIEVSQHSLIELQQSFGTAETQ